MNVTDYLARIGISDADLAADAGSLKRLQRQHLLHVPFENLDIHWKWPIALDLEKFYSKVVDERRGGFCYELNGLFDEMLKGLGYSTRLISARVYGGGKHGPEYDHAAIVVSIGEKEYLADVGFGDFTAEPLRYVLDEEQHDACGTFIIRRFDDDYIEVAKRDGDKWKSEYIFRDIPRALGEFAEMCDFQQYSPESHFTRGKICSLLTETGRKTLTDSRFILTTQGTKTEFRVESYSKFADILEREFAISGAETD